jgi:hypothetical protein
MSIRRSGLIAGVALAAGLAIGTVGSSVGSNPTFDPGRHPMMGGRGMMGGSGYGPGMMRYLSPAECDERRDAMHDRPNGYR